MEVLLPSALISYTGTNKVQADGATLAELLADLDRQYPGLRFRVVDEQDNIRAHLRFFVNGEQVFDLAYPLHSRDAVCLVQALSGG